MGDPQGDVLPMAEKGRSGSGPAVWRLMMMRDPRQVNLESPGTCPWEKVMTGTGSLSEDRPQGTLQDCFTNYLTCRHAGGS